jgi:hypothetical protein
MSYKRFHWLILGLIALVGGCGSAMLSQKNYQQSDYTLVETDTTYSLTMPEFYRALAATDRLDQGGVIDTNEARAFLDSLVCDTLTGFEAQSIDLEEYDRTNRLFEKQFSEYLVALFQEIYLYRPGTPDSAAVDSFYYARPDLFAIEEQTNIHHISITGKGLVEGHDSAHYRPLSPEQLAEETRAYVFDIRAMIDSAGSFYDIARLYSQDTFRLDKSGGLGWIIRGTYLDPFDSVAFSLDSGEVSEPYQDKDAWHILFCGNHAEAGIPPMDAPFFESAFSTLMTIRANELGQTVIGPLRENVYLELNQEILDEDIYGLPSDEWVAIVEGLDTIDVYQLRYLEEEYRRNYGIESSTAEMKQEMVGRLASVLVVEQEARRLGVDTLPEAVEMRQRFFLVHTRNIVIQDWFTGGWIPLDSVVKAYYESHLDDFTVDRPLWVQQLIVEDSIFGEYLRDQAMSGIDFLDLAAEHSRGDKSLSGGQIDLGFVGPGDISDVLYKAASRTLVGEASFPVRTELGYHLIKLVERNDSMDEIQARHIIVPLLKRRHAAETFRARRERHFAK